MNSTVGDLLHSIKELNPAQQTSFLIQLLDANPLFEKISRDEANLLVQRDKEDAEKLQRGVDYALDKKILSVSDKENFRWSIIDVEGKTPDDVLQLIVKSLPDNIKGTTLLICGESGVGKGTLVDLLSSHYPHALQWSNGDIFRLYTYLFLQNFPSKKDNLDGISLEELDVIRQLISIEGNEVLYNDGVHRIPIKDVKNTLFKTNEINRLLPSFAYYLQGEVINFTNRFIKDNSDSFVIIEGRKATLQHINSPVRFELIHSQKSLLGARRAAQKIIAACHSKGKSVALNDLLEQYQ
ncbi:ATP-binding protein [Spirochaeta cellobiosiphila]|uniref:ATP-binding protein n=1 Tax=Spirochaeta cellobiosiphila TaxID=504483 RepID=UPI0003FACFEF|nr:ATP-binding protein [Spirochaeta cellobiosiphila]